MTINLKDTLKTLGNQTLLTDDERPFTVGEALANVLCQDICEGSKLKRFVLAQKCFQDTELELDSADHELLRNAVQTSKLFNNLVLGQLELVLSQQGKS